MLNTLFPTFLLLLKGSTSESSQPNAKTSTDEIIDDKAKNGILSIPVFRNGHTSHVASLNGRRTIVTYNTCGFDSSLSIYFDDPHFGEIFFGHSKFAVLVKSYFDTFNSKLKIRSLEMNKLYDDRNIILKEIFSNDYYKNCKNVKKNGEMIFIDCVTGIGQLCLELCHNIGSAIEKKTCGKCKKTFAKVLPFFSIPPNVVKLHNLQEKFKRFTKKLMSRLQRQMYIE